MWKVVLTLLVWFLGFICIKIMKKIEPDNKMYPVWVLFIAMLFTLFAVYDWLG